MIDYKKKYLDALERANSFQEKYGGDYAGYIFPELRESEDERIRKFLVDYFVSYKIDNVTTKLNGVRIDDILNYLEKQKEQKPAEKPSMLELLREYLANTPKEQLDAEFEALKEFTIPKPTEWSDEDELMIKCCLRAIEHYKYTGKPNVFRPSQFDIDGYLISPEKVQTWLKLLRNRVGKEFLQPHWKPSEEQIKTLKCLPGLLRNFKLDSSARMLEVLYEQLKKLM